MKGFAKITICHLTILTNLQTSHFYSTFPPVRTDSQVVDIDGHKIGKVKRLHRHPDTKGLESIEISDGIMHSKILSKSEIWGVGIRYQNFLSIGLNSLTIQGGYEQFCLQSNSRNKR